MKIAYVVSDLKRVGPSNQTLNIIKNSIFKDESIVITLFEEQNDTMINEYKKNNIKIICLDLNRFSFMVSGKKKLKNILEKNKVDIVHSYGIKPDCLCNKVLKKSKIVHIITLRNYPKEDILTRMNYVKGKIALHNHLKALLECKHVICCSKTICDKMSTDYPNKKFIHIQNGVDTEKYKKVSKTEKEKLRKKYNFNNKDRIYISTSSFIPRKRIDETIEGFLKSNIKDSILLLVGNGPLFGKLKQNYFNENNIVFYGKSNNVDELLNLSDVFISSSESEGLPNGVIEAISCGIPVILSNIPQHEEILAEFKNVGKTYQLGDVDNMSKIIRENNLICLGSIEKSPFTMKNMSKKYIELYKTII